MTTPELLPILSKGSHKHPRDGACLMEYVSLLAGQPWSDSPACTHPVLASMARAVNDRLPDDRRQELLTMVPRLIGTADDRDGPLARRVLTVRLTGWCAEQVLPLVREQDRQVCERAIVAARAWADDPTAAAADAAAAAADAADAAAAADPVALLSGLIDEHARLTGHSQPAELTTAQLRQMCEVTA